MKRFVSLALIATLPLTAACDNGGTSTSTTAPSIVLTTDTFMGTVPVGGSDFNNFTVAQAGPINITLIAAGPPSTITMGLGVGTGGSTCVLAANGIVFTPAGTTAQLFGTAGAGTLCVEVWDLLSQSLPVDYTVTVSHP